VVIPEEEIHSGFLSLDGSVKRRLRYNMRLGESFALPDEVCIVSTRLRTLVRFGWVAQLAEQRTENLVSYPLTQIVP
jgi:hypothetical protein